MFVAYGHIANCNGYEINNKVSPNVIDKTYRAGLELNFEIIVRDKVSAGSIYHFLVHESEGPCLLGYP